MKYTVKVNEMPLVLADRTIYGKAFIPENKDGKDDKLRAVIMSHGYNSSHEDLADLAHALAENGVFAYCYDFCGGSLRSRSSGSSEQMSVSTEMLDLKAVIGYIGELGYIDKDNMFLYGESQGGFVTALTADEKIKGLFLLYPAFCIPDDWGHMREEGRTENVEFMDMTLSKCYWEGIPDYDVFEHIGKYPNKVMIFHGDADAVVNIKYAHKAAASFKNAELTVFEKEGHGFSAPARDKLIRTICTYFIEK